ncbi:MAG TPA: membrane dipeptidase [Candidatus Pullichristensenella avicola]|nr:membrane dipeptidase [Candidatus Pullichristensenella avicola]
MFIADAHCDALHRMVAHDRERTVTPQSLRAGGVGVQALAIFAGDTQNRGYHRAAPMLEALRAFGAPVLAEELPATPPQTPHVVVTVEGGELFEGDPAKLRALDAQARLRMLGLTWNFENELACPALSGSCQGLKPRGREFLAEMGRLRILADVSHLNEAGFWDVCERSALPPVASHSDCRWLCDTPRNLTREQARAIFQRRGFVGVNFFPEFLREDGVATIDDVVRHIDALMELGGEDCVGFGSDFDGISSHPEGLASPADVPRILEALEKRGYTQKQVAGVAGLNLYRVLRETNRV